MAYDPFKSDLAARTRAANYRRQKGLPKGYILTEPDLAQVLDPLAFALSKDAEGFSKSLNDYLSPYSGRVKFLLESSVRLLSNTGNGDYYQFSLGVDDGDNHIRAVRVQNVPLKQLFNLSGIGGVYDIFDSMAESYASEIGLAQTQQRRLAGVVQNELARSGDVVMLEPQQRYFFNKFYQKTAQGGLILRTTPVTTAWKNSSPLTSWNEYYGLADEQPVLSDMPPEPVEKHILCPEHKNPMMRRAQGDDRLYCPVYGCRKRARPKSSAPKPEPEKPEATAGSGGSVAEEGSNFSDRHIKFEEVLVSAGLLSGGTPFDKLYNKNPTKPPTNIASKMMAHSEDDFPVNEEPVRFVQRKGRYYLVQAVPGTGLDIRIDATEHIEHIRGEASGEAFKNVELLLDRLAQDR